MMMNKVQLTQFASKLLYLFISFNHVLFFEKSAMRKRAEHDSWGLNPVEATPHCPTMEVIDLQSFSLGCDTRPYEWGTKVTREDLLVNHYSTRGGHKMKVGSSQMSA